MQADREIIVVEDADALAERAAATIRDVALDAVRARDRFTIALAGGATPRATYEKLAARPYGDAMPWDRAWVFFGDERAVAPDHPESNYRMASTALLSRVPIPPGQIFRMPADMDDGEAAAAAYTRTLSEVFGTPPGEPPRFDLVLLGLGVDGHTASLFPGASALKEPTRPVVAVHAAAASIPGRLTLTLRVFNAAAHVVFLVAGAEKAKVVKAVLQERSALPAALVAPEKGTLVWLLDRAAAALLKR